MTDLELIRREFGELVRKHREAKNLSQDGLAKLLDMERQQIYRIENGLSGTRKETAKRLAEILDFDENLALSYAAGIRPNQPATFRTVENAQEFLEVLEQHGINIPLNMHGIKNLEKVSKEELNIVLNSMLYQLSLMAAAKNGDTNNT